jgi:hypothetical protein
MTQPQQFQLVKNRQDAIMDIASFMVFLTLLYLVINPEKYNRMTAAVMARYNAVLHRLSVWQTKLSIRSLPETDE